MLNILIVAALCVLSSPLSVAGAAETATGLKAAWTYPPQCVCPCTNYTTIPLYYAAHPTLLDRIYTTRSDELVTAESAGYVRQPDAGRVLGAPASDAIPLYRLRNDALADHLYTISDVERDNTLRSNGWVYEGIAAYVLPGPSCSTLPFYRAYNAVSSAHFYTTNPDQLVNAVTTFVFVFESVAGYIWSSD